MKINNIEIGGEPITEIISDSIELSSAQDAVDMMAKCFPSGSRKLIIHQKNICPEFFDLKTRVAGEILQKFINYYFKIAIVGDFSKYTSKTLKDFIYESNKHGEINFVESVEEARQKLTKTAGR